MAYVNDLRKRINDNFKDLSKSQRIIATYILEEPNKAAFMTADKLGQSCNVSESTVVRFASTLGYKGFPEFQKALSDMVLDKIENEPRITINHSINSPNDFLSSVLSNDILRLQNTISTIDSDVFNLAIDTILNAKNVYIIGIRACSALADFLSFYLTLLLPNVKKITSNNSSEIFEQMLNIGNNDCIIGISFPRYSLRTIKALEYASSKNARIITITDSPHSPINLYSSCNLISDSNMSNYIDSLVAPMSVINAILLGIIARNPAKTAKTFEELEYVWDNYQEYSKDEIELINDSLKYRKNEK